jgi:2-dehydro-3-deoxyphosphogluconate aldolase/(4S)-4-hydroxy-2-oxoglutarate aldolase
MNPISDLLRLRVIAVVRLHDASRLDAAIDALVAGGIHAIEITLNTENALTHLAKLARRDGVIAGAGTVLTSNDARRALDAGARFLVSPVFFPEMVTIAHAAGAAALPSGLTPTELLAAHRAGADACKIFPLAGLGPNYLRAILGPLPDLKLVPTNGVTVENAKEFLEAGAAAVGVGTPLISQEIVDGGDFEMITAKAAALVASCRGN